MPNDTPDDDQHDLFDAFEITAREFREAMDATGDDADPAARQWLAGEADALMREALGAGFTPAMLSAFLAAYRAMFNARVTAAQNAVGKDSPFGTLDQELEMAKFAGMPYHEFMSAMEEYDPAAAYLTMTPDDLPPELREQMERQLQAVFGEPADAGRHFQ